MRKNITKIDDGYRSWLVAGAEFERMLDIPIMSPPKRAEIPKNLIPFSKMKTSVNRDEFIHFYLFDAEFRDFLQNPESYVEQMIRFPGVITPDCSLYRDMPLALQIANTYLNRAAGCFLQEQGINTYANIRWGDERSYTPALTDIPFAFLGAPKRSILSVSTYGCYRSREDKKHFRRGFEAMLKYLEPEIVLIHGTMPNFLPLGKQTYPRYVHYEDLISRKKKGAV